MSNETLTVVTTIGEASALDIAREAYAKYLRTGESADWVSFVYLLPGGVYLLRGGSFYRKNPVEDCSKIIAL